jgi:chemotaxis protein CheY-P-specific phosphatase CheC
VTQQNDLWNRLISGPAAESLLDTIMKRVAHGLSGMVGRTITSNTPQVKKMPTFQAVAQAKSTGKEMLGIFMKIEGGLNGRTILMLPVSFALNLVDLLLEQPSGTTTKLDSVGRSALGEVGNLTLSHFLNATALLMSRSEILYPSPPTVIVDMLDTVLNLAVAQAAMRCKDLLVIETTFTNTARTVKFRFWILPEC